MKQTFLLMLSIAFFACKHNSPSPDENGWELNQSIKYKNSFDNKGRIIEIKESIFIYSDGQELGSKLPGITNYNYEANGQQITERHFDIDNNGFKILTRESIDYYTQKGVLRAHSYKKYGLLVDSIIKSYDDAGRPKIEAFIRIRNRPKNTQDASKLISQGTISYDTSFLYNVYDNAGVLKMQKVLDNKSKTLSTNHYTYVNNQLHSTYRISNSNDILDKSFYEYEKDGSLKETSLISGQDLISATWKKDGKIIKELSIGTSYKSMRKYIYDRNGHLIEERTYY